MSAIHTTNPRGDRWAGGVVASCHQLNDRQMAEVATALMNMAMRMEREQFPGAGHY